MKRIWSWLLQLAFLVAATFLFIVLFAHGPSNFLPNAQQEFAQIISWVKGDTGANFPSPK